MRKVTSDHKGHGSGFQNQEWANFLFRYGDSDSFYGLLLFRLWLLLLYLVTQLFCSAEGLVGLFASTPCYLCQCSNVVVNCPQLLIFHSLLHSYKGNKLVVSVYMLHTLLQQWFLYLVCIFVCFVTDHSVSWVKGLNIQLCGFLVGFGMFSFISSLWNI